MLVRVPKPGTLVGGEFKLVKELGRGAMGVVFEAVQSGLERKVALKMLLPRAMGSHAIVERFEREARLASSLTSPHTVTIYTYGVHKSEEGAELPYIVMECLEGQDLHSHLIKVGRLPLHEALDVIRQVLKPLEEAHKKNIIHRDLKPKNIFLSKRPRTTWGVTVLDFGLAKAI